MKTLRFLPFAIALLFALPAHAVGFLFGQPMRPDTWIPASKVGISGFSYNNLQSLLDSGTLGGGGSGDSILVGGSGVTDTLDLLAGNGIEIVFAGDPTTPNTATIRFNYSDSPTSNSLATKRCVFSNYGTYGGILCEGSGASDDYEFFLQTPVSAATGGDVLVSFPVLPTSASFHQICMDTTYGAGLCSGYAAGTAGVADTADAGDSATGFFSTGTLGQSIGGTGAGSLSCGTGVPLTSNGTAQSCATTVYAHKLNANDGGNRDIEYDTTRNAWYGNADGSGTAAVAGDDILVTALNFGKKVLDFDNDGDYCDDLEAAITACGTGIDASTGCTVVLPAGRLNCATEVTVGTCTSTATIQPSVSIVGQGMPGIINTSTNAGSAGTSLVWGGADEATMLNVCGADGFYLGHIGFQMDPNADNTGNEAWTAIRLSAKNTASTTTQSPVLDHVRVWSRYDTGVAPDTETVGIHITGEYLVTGNVTSVDNPDGAGPEVRINTNTTHGMAYGEYVTISGTVDYDGTWQIKGTNPPSSFDIEDDWNITREGTFSANRPDDQVDKIDMRAIRTSGVAIGVKNDNGQAVAVTIGAGSDIFGEEKGIEVTRGTVNIRDAVLGCHGGPGCIMYDIWQNFTYPAFSITIGPNVGIETNESGNTFLRCGGNGDTSRGFASGNYGPIDTILVIGNHFLSEDNDDLNLIDCSMQTSVTFQNNQLRRNGSGVYNIEVGTNSGYTLTYFNWLNNFTEALSPDYFGTVDFDGPDLVVNNPQVEPVSKIRYNDVDFDFVADPNEVDGVSRVARTRTNSSVQPTNGQCLTASGGGWEVGNAAWSSTCTEPDPFWYPTTDLYITEFCFSSWVSGGVTVGSGDIVDVQLYDSDGASAIGSVVVADSGGDTVFGDAGVKYCDPVAQVVTAGTALKINAGVTGTVDAWGKFVVEVWGVPIGPTNP